MAYAVSLVMGYLLGALSPAALIGKWKKQDLRQTGTKNLGASNTMLTFGKALGALVMVFDIFKSFLACKLAKLLFPAAAYVALVAGLAAILGHIFPFYLGFRGGKGLAAFGGMVLAYDPWMFLGLLALGCILMWIFNYSAVMPMSAGTLFPILAGLTSMDIRVFLLALAAGVLVIVKHASNLTKGRQGKDLDIRGFMRNWLGKK